VARRSRRDEADRGIGHGAELQQRHAADAAIAELGLLHSLVTSRTSLVAVDETPGRPAGTPLTREDLPINLPAGWDFDALFGGEAARAALANAGTMAARAAEQADGLNLPQTATGFGATMGGGLFLLIVGAAGLVVLRRLPGKCVMAAPAFGRRGIALIGLCCLGLARIAAGAVIPVKAVAAQILPERAFDRSVSTRRARKPWPWPTWPLPRGSACPGWG